MKNRIAGLLAAVLCISLLAVPALAYVRVDTSRATSLTVNYYDSEREKAVDGMALRIYKVCSMTDAVRFEVTPEFETYAGQVKLPTGDMTQSAQAQQWMDLANTLAGLVAVDEAMVPTATATTDEEGNATFTGLSVGLYLVVGDVAKVGSYRYTPQSFMITLPYLEEDDTWSYDAQVSGKYSRRHTSNPPTPPGPSGDTVSRNVVKMWKDEGLEENRPESVTVQLLQDGKVYETVTLNKGNNWKHSWTKLSADSDWQVVEKGVPEGYTVLVTKEGNTFVVTNTAEKEIPDDPTPEGPNPDEPTPDEPKPEEPIPDEPVPGQGLPQTGTLWWPVQVLTIAGVLLFSLGWLEFRRGKKSQNEA